ncbi:hypothetical protein D3C72_1473410 [compost metagenome]
MARNQNQQQIGEFLQQLTMRLQDNLFFAVVSTGGNPDLAAWSPLAAQRDGAGSEFWRDGNIKFQTAGDGELVALQSQRDESRAVFFVLGGNQRNFRQQATHKTAQFAIPFSRTFRQARVGDNQRNFTGMQSGNHIRPQFGFHHDHQLRAHGVKETVHGTG